MMKVQVLVAAVDQDPRELVHRMRLDSDALIVNQCERYAYEQWQEAGHTFRVFSMKERGVGLSRNTALMRAEGEICLFSDQDIVYEPDYERKISEEFERHPEADMLLFNIQVEASRRTYLNTGYKRVHLYNCGRYGAVSFAIRRSALRAFGVTFSLLFGGGAAYSNGEDSLFLQQLIKKGCRVYTSAVVIGTEQPSDSTWFSGYHEKFFFDRGVLYAFLYGGMAPLMSLRFLLAHRSMLCKELSIREAKHCMKAGCQEGRKLCRGRGLQEAEEGKGVR